MKYNCLFVKAWLWMVVCTCWMLVSCEKSQEMTVSAETLLIEAFPGEQPTIDISTSVSWTVTVEQGVNWLEVNPTQGKGNATITVTVAENSAFSTRTAWIAVSGDGVKTDTIKVVQEPGINVAEKIEDEPFRKYCLNHYDQSPKDGKLSLAEARAVTTMDVSKLGIYSLAGIEYFTKLKQLVCSKNHINNIDLSNNKDLTRFECYNNELTELNVSENVKLKELNCTDNMLTNIDVSKNTALTWLSCSINQLTSIDVNNNTELTILDCDQNELTSLDVSKNTKLGRLSCGNNKIKSLDVRNNTLVTQLWCGDNLFTSLDLSQNKDLQMLYCNNSLLANFNLGNNIALTFLNCSGSKQLTSIDLTKNTQLAKLYCAGTALSGNIDISLNTKLIEFDLDNLFLAIIYVWQGFDQGNTNYKKNAKTRYEVK